MKGVINVPPLQHAGWISHKVYLTLSQPMGVVDAKNVRQPFTAEGAPLTPLVPWVVSRYLVFGLGRSPAPDATDVVLELLKVFR